MSNKPLCPAKLTAPDTTRAHPRRRLFRRLDALRRTAATWVVAPPGAGKTTLVASYLQDAGIRPLWYRLDAEDHDPATFFYFLGEGLRRHNRSRKRILPLLTPEYRDGLTAFTHHFFRKLFAAMKPPAVLVLDDLESLHDSDTLAEILRHALEDVPAGGHLFLLSRCEAPAGLSRAQATGRLARLGWRDLQLSDDEGREIARVLAEPHPLSRKQLARLQATASGWVTGLVLQLQQMEHNTAGHAATPRTLLSCDSFEDYFSSEVFRHLSTPTRDLLLRTAWLDCVRPAEAAHLAGLDSHAEAERLLETLARRQPFVTRLETASRSYAYHPLLRAFLRERAVREMPAVALRTLQQQTARLLESAGNGENAASLYHETGDMEALARLIHTHAEQLLQQGRHQRLGQWLSWLPQAMRETDPWLSYWQGSALLPHDPRTAAHHFRNAYRQQSARGDVAGLYLAWLGIMDSIIFANGSLADIPHWLAELERAQHRFGPPPTPAIAGRVAFTAFNMGFTACPESRPLADWLATAGQLRQRLPEIDDATTRCLAASHLAMFFTWHPQPARLQLLADELRTYLHDERIAPLARAIAALVEITRRWNSSHREGTDAFIDHALAEVEHHGIGVARLWLLSAATIYHLTQQDTQRARDALTRYRRHIRPANRHEQIHHDYLSGWLAWLRGDTALARELTGRALADILPLHTPHFELLARSAHAFVLIEADDHEQAQELIRETRARAEHCHSRSVAVFQLGLLEAWQAYRRGEGGAVTDHLRTALACGREMDLQIVLWHLPPILAQLCALALEHGIETGYVQRLIRRNALPRPPQAAHLPAWPVALRIRTCGTFRLERDGTPLDPTSHPHRKPLRLLRVLIALGGREVPAERLEDILWPDADGGDARRALITTVQRLRKLLGGRRRLRFEDGRLGLDESETWLDTWALEADLDNDDPHRLEQALRLYEGLFLRDEGDPPWLLATRERLHDTVLRGYERLAALLGKQHRWEELAELCRRGLAIDDLHEPFYREHMRALTHLGREAEALRIYRRCQKRLRESLDTSPSPATRRVIDAQPD